MNLLPFSVEPQLRAFGMRLRTLRQQRGWTLGDLSQRSGFSAAFLSRLESSDRQASIAAVLTLAGVFGVSLASLFEAPAEEEPCLVVRAADSVRHQLNGLTYAPLSDADRFPNIQPLRVTVSPKRAGDEHFRHAGSEWIYVLSGRLTLSLSGKLYHLDPGDAAHFDARRPHRLIARGRKDAQLLLVACPFPEHPRAAEEVSFRERRAIPPPQRSNSPERVGF